MDEEFRYLQITSRRIKERLVRLDSNFGGYTLAHLEAQYMIMDVLDNLEGEKLDINQLPSSLILNPDKELGEHKSESSYSVRKHEQKKFYEFSRDARKVTIDGSALFIVVDTFYNGQIEDYMFIYYRDKKQLEIFSNIYGTTLRKLLASENVIIDLTNDSKTDKPNVSIDDVIIPDDLKADILSNTVGFFNSRKVYDDLGVSWKRGIIFAGEPGVGKTMMLKALASVLPFPFGTISLSANTSDVDIVRYFKAASRVAPMTMVIEDLDRIDQTSFNLSTFLNIMDGVNELEGILIIATTNAPDKIDPALMSRPSRFDRKYHFKMPDNDKKMALAKKLSKNMFSDERLTTEISNHTDGFSMATVKETILSALTNAALDGRPPTDDDLGYAFAIMRSEVESSKHGMKDGAPAGFGPKNKAVKAKDVKADVNSFGFSKEEF